MKYLLFAALTGLMFTASCESQAFNGVEGLTKKTRVLFLDGKGAGISLEALSRPHTRVKQSIAVSLSKRL